MKKTTSAWLVIMITSGALAHAQSASQDVQRRPGAMTAEAATVITQGWALLAQGLLAEAAGRADAALAQDPLNPSALSLAVEVDIARTGPLPALALYEHWLGSRRTEAPFVVRRVARAVLSDVAQAMTGALRSEALAALAGDGDPAAATALAQGLADDELSTDVITLAKMGSQAAVQRLIERLDQAPPDSAALVRVLGASRHPDAVEPLTRFLADPRIEVRAEAATALGKIGDRRAIDALRPLLSDMYPAVKLQAAAALALLDDSAGTALLREFEDSEYDGVRIAAAAAMASRPDPGWVERVRNLTASGDALVSIQAGVLLAPHDPAAAAAVLARHQGDPNAGVREAANLALSGEVAADLPTLRAYMRGSDLALRVRAAARILIVTR